MDPFLSVTPLQTPHHPNVSRRRPNPPIARPATWFAPSTAASTSTPASLSGSNNNDVLDRSKFHHGRSRTEGEYEEDDYVMNVAISPPANNPQQQLLDALDHSGGSRSSTDVCSDGSVAKKHKPKQFRSTIKMETSSPVAHNDSPTPSSIASPSYHSHHDHDDNDFSSLHLSSHRSFYEESPIKARISHSKSLGRSTALGGAGKGKSRPLSMMLGVDGVKGSKSMPSVDGSAVERGSGDMMVDINKDNAFGTYSGGLGSDDESSFRPRLKPLSFTISRSSSPTRSYMPDGVNDENIDIFQQPQKDDASTSTSSYKFSIPNSPGSISLSAESPYPSSNKSHVHFNTLPSGSQGRHLFAPPPPPNFSQPVFTSKKAASMDNLQPVSTGRPRKGSLLGGLHPVTSASASVSGSAAANRLLGHRRGVSSDNKRTSVLGHTLNGDAFPFTTNGQAQNISRSSGLRSGLTLAAASPSSTNPFAKADPSLNRSAPASTKSAFIDYQRRDSNAQGGLNSSTSSTQSNFDDIRPLQTAFEAKAPVGGIGKKFKPRDSGVSGIDGDTSIDSIQSPFSNSTMPPPVSTIPRSKFNLTHAPDLQISIPPPDDQERSGAMMTIDDLLITPSCEAGTSAWPSNANGGPSNITLAPGGGLKGGFNFLGAEAAEVMASAAAHGSTQKMMPDTPVKRAVFGAGNHGGGLKGGLGEKGGHKSLHQHLQPIRVIASTHSSGIPVPSSKVASSTSTAPSSLRQSYQPPASIRPLTKFEDRTSPPTRSMIPTLAPRTKPSPTAVFQVQITKSSPPVASSSSSPPPEAESPTVLRRSYGGLGSTKGSDTGEIRKPSLLKRASSTWSSTEGSDAEEARTPTRRGGLENARKGYEMSSTLGNHSNLSPLPLSSSSSSNLQPRHSLPNFPAASSHTSRSLHHRQSHPLRPSTPAEDSIFDARFVKLETLGQGAFSEVWKVQEKHGEGLWAVKRMKGVFDGAKDRLRHLEEVDILRILSDPSHPHVIQMADAWEQDRQLFIQTELCPLGNFAFFLEEYGRTVERIDEGRVWKIVRELADGVHHIHSNNIIHLDIKPANILITNSGSLKIGDFGLSSRYPRADPAVVLDGAGLGGEVPGVIDHGWEREGDRNYMAPETLRGVFGKEADIFSFGLLVLETATNIIVPEHDQPWHALRSNDFSHVDLTYTSAMLTELIVLCMRHEPSERPAITDLVNHLAVSRARKLGQEALVPEPESFLVEILAGGMEMLAKEMAKHAIDEQGDVEMDIC